MFEDGQIIGGCRSPLLEMSIPDGASVVADMEMQPTHARQGMMTRLMRHRIDGIRERGEPLAALLATESGITGVPAASALCTNSGTWNRGTTLTPTAHSETSHRKVRSSAPLGPP